MTFRNKLLLFPGLSIQNEFGVVLTSSTKMKETSGRCVLPLSVSFPNYVQLIFYWSVCAQWE